jgi:hypothetical protein
MMLWLKKLACYFRGHEFKAFEDHTSCTRCGKLTFSRAQLLKQLLPGLNVLFKMEYDEYKKPKEKT